MEEEDRHPNRKLTPEESNLLRDTLMENPEANITLLARELHISRPTVYREIERLEIDLPLLKARRLLERAEA